MDEAALISKMQSVLQFDGKWHARAIGSQGFATAATPGEAMRAALLKK